MKATGIVRRIDSLGRIVIPREIRRAMRIKEGDCIEIYTDKQGDIILSKYSPMGELENCCRELADSMALTLGKLVIITDNEKILAVSGVGKGVFKNRLISSELRQLILKRNLYCIQKDVSKVVPVIKETEVNFESQIVGPIVADGEVIGSVIILSDEKHELTASDRLMVRCAAGFFGKQME